MYPNLPTGGLNADIPGALRHRINRNIRQSGFGADTRQ
jgi:hypothetical protein